MSNNINIKIWERGDNTYFDVSKLVQKIVWSGRDGTPSRSLEVTLIDSDEFDRPEISVIKGYQCLFKWKGAELFRGIIVKTSQSNKGTMSFKAYDVGFYLSNNKDAFSYKKKKPHEIFKDICKKFGLKYDNVSRCSVTVSEISKVTTAWDVIETSLQEEYEKTGIRHAVTASEGKLNLITKRENIVKWLLESDENIISWTYSDSIEKIKTRIKLYSSKNKTLATAKDASLENKIGIFQDTNKPDDKITKKSKLKSLANSILKEEKQPERILNIQAYGLSSMTTGRGAFVIIPEVNLNKTFYITQDTHTFESNDKYTMSLQLKKTTDLDY